jgi:hypothetical protein
MPSTILAQALATSWNRSSVEHLQQTILTTPRLVPICDPLTCGGPEILRRQAFAYGIRPQYGSNTVIQEIS